MTPHSESGSKFTQQMKRVVSRVGFPIVVAASILAGGVLVILAAGVAERWLLPSPVVGQVLPPETSCFNSNLPAKSKVFDATPQYGDKFVADVEVIACNEYRQTVSANKSNIPSGASVIPTTITIRQNLCSAVFEQQWVKCEIVIRDAPLVIGQTLKATTLYFHSVENGRYTFTLSR